jgi:PAS domain S-box-containing protein
MSGVTIIWSMVAAACLMLAGIHVLVWLRHRAAITSLALVFSSLGVVGFAAAELCLMYAETTDGFAALLRWTNAPVLCFVIGIVVFVRADFRTGRPALAALAIGLRALLLVVGFFPGPCIQYREILSLRKTALLGEWVTVVDQAVPSPMAYVAILANLAIFAFVVDATVSLARRGGAAERRRALWVGGSFCGFILLASVVGMLVNARVLHVPYFGSLSFLGIVAAMTHRLSRDILHAQRLVLDLRASEARLRESERRLDLAAESAELGLWSLDLASGRVWATDRAKAMFGFPGDTEVMLDAFMDRMHPEDRPVVQARIDDAVRQRDGYAADYRVLLPDGQERWIAARGEIVCDATGHAISMTGVVMDSTQRRLDEQELLQERAHLAHLARTATVAELSGSLAHELNQPLAIILTNAQAAQRLLDRDPPDIAEAREILVDIVREDQRAGEVIRRLRALLRNEPINLQPVSLNALVDDVLALMHRELEAAGIAVERRLAPSLPEVRGDPVQLQQVMLNLILNARDAMIGDPAGGRRLVVSTTCRDGWIRITVADSGRGLSIDPERIFEPFFTTKKDGLGLGLPICRTIVAAHKGRLWAEPRGAGVAPNGAGTALHLELKVLDES